MPCQLRHRMKSEQLQSKSQPLINYKRIHFYYFFKKLILLNINWHIKIKEASFFGIMFFSNSNSITFQCLSWMSHCHFVFPGQSNLWPVMPIREHMLQPGNYSQGCCSRSVWEKSIENRYRQKSLYAHPSTLKYAQNIWN